MSSTAPSPTANAYVCEFCGRGFSRIQGFARHLKETHGRNANGELIAAPEPAAPSFASQLAADMDRQMRELAATYAPRIAEIDKSIDAAQEVVSTLKAERREIESALKRLTNAHGKPGPKQQRKGKQQAEAALMSVAAREEHKLKNTRAWLVEHGKDYPDGISVNGLTEAMRRDKVAPAMSSQKIAGYVEQLRDEGLIRALGIGKGGGTMFALVSNPNGASANG